jgi:hypothetical protein
MVGMMSSLHLMDARRDVERNAGSNKSGSWITPLSIFGLALDARHLSDSAHHFPDTPCNRASTSTQRMQLKVHLTNLLQK